MRSVLPALAAIGILALGTVEAQASFSPSLAAYAAAGACGGSVSCYTSVSQTSTVLTTLSLNKPSTYGSNGDYANASATAAYGVLKVYADAHRAAWGSGTTPEPIGDAQSKANATVIDAVPYAQLSNGILNTSFVITGSHSLAFPYDGNEAYAYFSFTITDLVTNAVLVQGSWVSSNAAQAATIAVNGLVVPTGHDVKVQAFLEADAYAWNQYVTTTMVSDYSHTLNIGMTTGADNTPVTGFSGHIYSIVAVPEPAALGLLGLGLAGVAGLRRRR